MGQRTIDEEEDDGVDVANGGAGVVGVVRGGDLLAALPVGEGIGGEADEVEGAGLQGGGKCLLDAVLLGLEHAGGEAALEAWAGAEGLDDGDVGQGLLGDGRGGAGGVGHGHGEPLGEGAAHGGHDEEGGDEGDEYAGEPPVPGEGDDVGGDEEGDAGHDHADLLGGAGLDGLDVGVEAGRELAGLPGVEEGGVLAEEHLEVAVADPPLDATAEDVPGDDVDVDEGEDAEAEVEEDEDLVVDALLDLLGGGQVDAGLTAGPVEVVEKVAEEDTHEGEGDAGSAGGQGADDDEQVVDPCRVGVEEKLEEAQERLLGL